MNPDTIAFAPGGLYKQSALISGTVGTASDSPVSRDLYRKFRAAMIGDFQNIKGIYVGPESLNLMKNGIRLTHNLRSPKDYDLAL